MVDSVSTLYHVHTMTKSQMTHLKEYFRTVFLWWHMPQILALRSLGQGDFLFKASMDYTATKYIKIKQDK